jgi:hypothetical protein
MSSKITVSRFVGLVFLVAALSSGTASAMSVEGTTPQGLKADGLRLQGLADRYVQMSGSTQEGLKADGLRLQGLADRYAQMSGYTQDGLRADGLRYQAMARAYESRPAASFYTPQALKAEGLRWQAMGQAYAQPSQVVRESGFDWGAAGIGAIGVFVAMLCAAVLILAVRRVREEKLAV